MALIKIFFPCTLWLLTSLTLAAQENWLIATSSLSHTQTVEILQKNVEQKGFRIFNTIDHAQGAVAAGLTLRPTTLIIFGNPKGGTLVMNCDQKMGMVLPLKILVWEDDTKQVKVGFIDPEQYSKEYNLEKCMDVLVKMKGALTELIKSVEKK